eukprot:s2033_g7.t1
MGANGDNQDARDDTPESEVETVQLQPLATEHPQTSPGTVEEMVFDLFCVKYEEWQLGALSDDMVVRTCNLDVLTMMQAQFAMQGSTQLDTEEVSRGARSWTS